VHDKTIALFGVNYDKTGKRTICDKINELKNNEEKTKWYL
jgi:hypothetical protein